MSTLQALILAIVEGLTEFLPVSSTGHMIIASSLMGISSNPFVKTFTVAIQLGAILSVVVIYWRRFLQSISFYFILFVGFLPAAALGFLLNDYIDQLLDRVDVVGWMLVAGGLVFLFIDRIFPEKASPQNEANYSNALIDRIVPENAPEQNVVNYSRSLKIGFFQCIAMIPGVSRSAATIIGGLAQGLDKKTAAEFSFFLAVPTMLAATGYKLLKFYLDGNSIGQQEVSMLIFGNVVAFIVALVAIKSFIGYLAKNGFKIFGYYRIATGLIILLLYYFGAEIEAL